MYWTPGVQSHYNYIFLYAHKHSMLQFTWCHAALLKGVGPALSCPGHSVWEYVLQCQISLSFLCFFVFVFVFCIVLFLFLFLILFLLFCCCCCCFCYFLLRTECIAQNPGIKLNWHRTSNITSRIRKIANALARMFSGISQQRVWKLSQRMCQTCF